MENNPTTNDVINKVYIPSYSSTQPTPSYAGGYRQKTSETKTSYEMGAGILIDRGKIETEICTNIMLGLAQLQEGVKLIESKKNALAPEDWESESDKSYREYVDNFLVYMNEVNGFFEALSKKIIDDVALFEELDSYINKIISSETNISSWR